MFHCTTLRFGKTFPIYENEKYPIKIVTNTQNLPLYTIVILEVLKEDKVLEKVILNPGYLKGLPKKVHGDYFIVLRYNITSEHIELVLAFQKPSDQGNLRVIYLETDSESTRNELLINVKMQKRWERMIVRISLLLHWTLELIQRTLDHREGGFILESVGILICRATGGFPFSQASLIDTNSLEESISDIASKSDETNEAIFTFVPKIKDHMKKIGCKAGRDILFKTITIFHHPTKMDIVPAIKGYVRNDSTILCRASDGYPTPISKWIFVNGPKHSQLYFTLKNSAQLLHLRRNAPLGSKWTFMCQTSNHIPNSLNGGIAISFSFIIGEKPFPINLLLALVISFLLIVCFVGGGTFIYRSRTSAKSKKKLLTNLPLRPKDHGILRYHSRNNSSENKRQLINGSNFSTSIKNSKNSSFNSAYLELKDNNPVDLV